ncbi:syntaxin-8-like [Macrosteles quadrilineatus]|uniref:syntaxin-8-like n=1 Tax=Macrosteles quadrilineatus TaxID=74068 RepID=UPI0023E33170|nr:syntaxin-8-like [Macrosteles quadrilineatus]
MALSYLEMDKWLSDHASCEAEHRFIVELLNTRSYEPRTSKKYDLLSAKIRVQLKQFETSVKNLKLKLEDDFTLTHGEKERRYRLVESLESSIIQLTQKFNSRSGEEERRSLMGAVGELQSSGWASDEEPDTAPLLQSNDQIREHQQRLMRDQEDGLERLSQVISRQKDIARTIGNEVDYQNELVDNITNTMDRTNVSIQRETSHVQVITRTDNTCGYWIVILLLFIAIVFVGTL